MYVCVCNAVTDRAIREAAAEGVASLEELTRRTGCGDCCGSCVEVARQILAESRPARPLALPVLAAAA